MKGREPQKKRIFINILTRSSLALIELFYLLPACCLWSPSHPAHPLHPGSTPPSPPTLPRVAWTHVFATQPFDDGLWFALHFAGLILKWLIMGAHCPILPILLIHCGPLANQTSPYPQRPHHAWYLNPPVRSHGLLNYLNYIRLSNNNHTAMLQELLVA